eukprot:11601990-Ditylum_brightwellii.AAC.1
MMKIKLEWLSGRASAFGTEGCGLEPRLGYFSYLSRPGYFSYLNNACEDGLVVCVCNNAPPC